jgi:uncharacterized membrane protein YhaH (DUF805 family)
MASATSFSIPSLFSFKGRLRRSHYWLTGFGLGIVKAVVTVVMAAFSGQIETKDGGWVGVVVELLFLWPTLALLVKRGHDRDRPAWFSLGLLVIAIAATMGVAVGEGMHAQMLMIVCAVIIFGSFGFLLVDYGFIDGTQGPNRFGPSPKGIGAPSLDVAAAFD